MYDVKYNMDNKMIRILYFTFITPTEKFGGGIAVIQSLFSLCSFADVEYIGPEFDSNEFKSYGIKLSAVYLIKQVRSKPRRIFNLITKGITTSFYSEWCKTISGIDASKYDCCYMDFTRQDFVVDWAKKHRLPIVLRAHNVEADYFESMYQKNKSVISFMHKIFAKNTERRCVHNSDKILVLTNTDKNRFEELYENISNKIDLFPICVKHFIGSKREDLPEIFISLTGSLWFGPNADGTIWFLDRVWRNIDRNITKGYTLIIAGSNPNGKIMKLADELPDVEVYTNPEEIDAFYKQATIYVAPIFYGAGMKVKIAEALSCGLPVITTHHASAGYEKMGKFIRICDDADGFKKEIENLISMSEQEMNLLKEEILERFEDNYSLEESCRLMEKHISDVIKR